MRQTDESRVLAVLQASPDIQIRRLRTLAVMERSRCYAAVWRLIDLGLVERKRATHAKTKRPLLYRLRSRHDFGA